MLHALAETSESSGMDTTLCLISVVPTSRYLPRKTTSTVSKTQPAMLNHLENCSHCCCCCCCGDRIIHYGPEMARTCLGAAEVSATHSHPTRLRSTDGQLHSSLSNLSYCCEIRLHCHLGDGITSTKPSRGWNLRQEQHLFLGPVKLVVSHDAVPAMHEKGRSGSGTYHSFLCVVSGFPAASFCHPEEENGDPIQSSFLMKKVMMKSLEHLHVSQREQHNNCVHSCCL